MSTTDRQASQLAAFLQAEDRPMFKRLKSDSPHVAMCLGRPTGRFQSSGGFRIAAETARWWSLMRAMWLKKRRSLNCALEIYSLLFFYPR